MVKTINGAPRFLKTSPTEHVSHLKHEDVYNLQFFPKNIRQIFEKALVSKEDHLTKLSIKSAIKGHENAFRKFVLTHQPNFKMIHNKLKAGTEWILELIWYFCVHGNNLIPFLCSIELL